MGYGPIITAIDDGHVECTGGDLVGKCRTCAAKWPCTVMKRAKKDQVAYAENLAREERHRKAVENRTTTYR